MTKRSKSPTSSMALEQAEKACSKVIYAGETLIDLTADTVSAEHLEEGYTAHDRAGNGIVGTLKTSDDIYYCNGSTDNVELSNIAQDFFQNASDGDQKKINVVGTFGATSPYSGSGNFSPYVWMKLGYSSQTNKRIMFDFSNCSKITINCSTEKNYVFSGFGINLFHANIEVNSTQSVTNCYVIPGILGSDATGDVYCYNCNFEIKGYNNCVFSTQGTFDHCNVSVANTGGNNSTLFNACNGHTIIVNGGNYTCTCKAQQGTYSYVIYEGNAGCKVLISHANFPITNTSGQTQTHLVYTSTSDLKGIISNCIISTRLMATIVDKNSFVIGTNIMN